MFPSKKEVAWSCIIFTAITVSSLQFAEQFRKLRGTVIDLEMENHLMKGEAVSYFPKGC